MTDKAKSLLVKLVSEIEAGHENKFIELDLTVSPSILRELEHENLIVISNTVAPTVSVTDYGFSEIKE